MTQAPGDKPKLTDEERAACRSHPYYSEGFYDAQDGEPLFPDASREYQAGWEGFHVAREILERNGFARDGDGFSKTTTIRGRSALTQGGWDAK